MKSLLLYRTKGSQIYKSIFDFLKLSTGVTHDRHWNSKRIPSNYLFTKNEQKGIFKQQNSRLITAERWKCTQQHDGRRKDEQWRLLSTFALIPATGSGRT